MAMSESNEKQSQLSLWIFFNLGFICFFSRDPPLLREKTAVFKVIVSSCFLQKRSSLLVERWFPCEPT